MEVLITQKDIISDKNLFKNYPVDFKHREHSMKVRLGDLIDKRPLYQVTKYRYYKEGDKYVIERIIQYCTVYKEDKSVNKNNNKT